MPQIFTFSTPNIVHSFPAVARLLQSRFFTASRQLPGSSAALRLYCEHVWLTWPARLAGKYETAAKLMGLVQHAESDAWLSLGLSFHLNVLPMTRQLTTLCGFLWSRTLQVRRSQDFQPSLD